MYHIQKLCRQALWLKHGEVAASGDVYAVTQAYLAYQESKSAAAAPDRASLLGQNPEFHLLDLSLNGTTTPLALAQCTDLRVRARVHSREGRAPVVMFGIVRADGTPIYGVSSEMDGVRPVRESENVYCAEIVFPELALLPGSYVVKAHPLDPEGVRLFDTLERGLTVVGASREFGLVRLRHEWASADAPVQRAATSS